MQQQLIAAILLLVGVGAGSPAARAAPDQATKDRCTTYAQRAVQQYRLMKSHPDCQANTDPMNWQDNYDNHYNACLVFPQKMAQMADAARENHLQACGALSDATAAGSGAAASAPASGATSTGSPAADSPGAAANDPECHSAGGGPGYPGLPGTGVTGTHGSMVGNTLSFVVDGTRKRVSYAVVRPHFVLVQIHCTGKPSDNTGVWVWASADGKSGKEIVIDGSGRVVANDMTGAVTRSMIQGH